MITETTKKHACTCVCGKKEISRVGEEDGAFSKRLWSEGWYCDHPFQTNYCAECASEISEMAKGLRDRLTAEYTDSPARTHVWKWVTCLIREREVSGG